MGFYLRKAFRAGPIRFNLSRGGIGISAGVTGARLGLSSSGGAFVHGGRGGVYYRKSVGNWSGSAESDADTALPQRRKAAIELTEETGATFGVPDQPEEADRTEAPARPKSTSGGLIALCLVVALLLAAFLGAISWWVVAAGCAFAWLGIGLLGIVKKRAGDAYGRLLTERIATSDPLAGDVRAEIDAARAGRWVEPANARYFEQQAYLTLVDSGMATAWKGPVDHDRLARAERALSLDPAFVERTKLDAYRRAHVEATADHDLTEAEEAALEQARTAFGLSDSVLEEELSLLDRLQELRAIRDGALPTAEAETKLRRGEVCHLQSEGRLLKKRVLHSFSRDRQKYTVRGFVIDKAGTLLVTSKRVLLIHKGTTSIALDKILDLEVDEDRQLLTLTRDGVATPAYLTTPDALRAGAIIAAVADC